MCARSCAQAAASLRLSVVAKTRSTFTHIGAFARVRPFSAQDDGGRSKNAHLERAARAPSAVVATADANRAHLEYSIKCGVRDMGTRRARAQMCLFHLLDAAAKSQTQLRNATRSNDEIERANAR